MHRNVVDRVAMPPPSLHISISLTRMLSTLITPPDVNTLPPELGSNSAVM